MVILLALIQSYQDLERADNSLVPKLMEESIELLEVCIFLFMQCPIDLPYY